MKRLFIGIRLQADDSFRDFYSGLKDELADLRGIRWVTLQNLHFTLKFLGETEEHKIPALIEALRKTASQHEPFSFSLNGTGFFGGKEGLRVLWMGVSEAEALSRLAADIGNALAAAGFQGDTKAFKPHLTLARIKTLPDDTIVQQVFASNKNWKGCPQHIRGFELIESRLSPTGPAYLTLQKFGFGEK